MDNIKRIDNILYGPTVKLPENRGFGRTIFNKLLEYKNNTLLIDVETKEEWTYGDANKKCIRIALNMRDLLGVKAGDIVLSCTGNTMDAILPIYSALYLNAITVTLDPSIPLRDTIHLLKDVPPNVIFVTKSAIKLIENAVLELDIKPKIIVMEYHENHMLLSELLRPHPEENEFTPCIVEDTNSISVILFSSGTTGLPKGICHSHNNMFKACYSQSITAIDSSVMLYYTSFYWMSAFLFSTVPLLVGGKRLIPTSFSTESYLKHVQEYKVTKSFLAPTYAIQFNEQNTKNYNTDSLTEMFVAGSMVTAKHLRQLAKYFPKTKIWTGYGQTEFCVASMFNKYSYSLSLEKIGSCGVPFINCKIKIVDVETKEILGPNQKGEICVLSNMPFLTYYNKNSKDCFDEDGFMKSGDIGYFDEDNCLYFSDRLKEMFKYRSWHIVPASLEKVIYEHPAVQETIVVGIPHEFDDHHVLGLVTLKENYTVTEEELLNFVNSKLNDREQLRAGLKIIKIFPKTCTGKIARRFAKQLILDGNISELYN